MNKERVFAASLGIISVGLIAYVGIKIPGQIGQVYLKERRMELPSYSFRFRKGIETSELYIDPVYGAYKER